MMFVVSYTLNGVQTLISTSLVEWDDDAPWVMVHGHKIQISAEAEDITIVSYESGAEIIKLDFDSALKSEGDDQIPIFEAVNSIRPYFRNWEDKFLVDVLRKAALSGDIVISGKRMAHGDQIVESLPREFWTNHGIECGKVSNWKGSAAYYFYSRTTSPGKRGNNVLPPDYCELTVNAKEVDAWASTLTIEEKELIYDDCRHQGDWHKTSARASNIMQYPDDYADRDVVPMHPDELVNPDLMTPTVAPDSTGQAPVEPTSHPKSTGDVPLQPEPSDNAGGDFLEFE